MSVVAAIYAIVGKILGANVTGWTSLVLSVWFIGGVQLLALGLIGEYIGKIYKEVKQRPLFRDRKRINGAAGRIWKRSIAGHPTSQLLGGNRDDIR